MTGLPVSRHELPVTRQVDGNQGTGRTDVAEAALDEYEVAFSDSLVLIRRGMTHWNPP
jgi:hypothetical protein